MAQLLASREACYRETAQFTLDTTALSRADAVEAVIVAAREAFSWHSAT